MISSPPRPTVPGDVIVRPDGSADVIPWMLPLRVPQEVMGMTVAEWLGLNQEHADGP